MKKFLIYVDILGFDELGKEDGTKSNKLELGPEEKRKVFVERVKNKIKELKTTKKIEGSKGRRFG